MEGIISEIQRFCLHDGPGIRTTVFFKGCPLRCIWCHNPETNQPFPQVRLYPIKCICCGACAAVCPRGCHEITETSHVFHSDRCTHCGACLAACPTKALSLCGTKWSDAALLDYVMRDVPFYGDTGGMTLSGGEPMLQGEFACTLLHLAHDRGINTCVQTCGQFDPHFLPDLLQYADHIMWDIKHTDPKKHLEICKMPPDLILKNLRTAAKKRPDILLRSVVAVGITDTGDHIEALGALAASLGLMHSPKLLAFHPYGASKADEVGWQKEKMGAEYIPSDTQMAELQAQLDVCFAKKKQEATT